MPQQRDFSALRASESHSVNVILSPSAWLGTGSAKDPYDDVYVFESPKGFSPFGYDTVAPIDAQNDIYF